MIDALQAKAAYDDDYSVGKELIQALLEADYLFEMTEAIADECRRQSIACNNNQIWAHTARQVETAFDSASNTDRHFWNLKYD
ncbi:MAG TPA: hypothetical protein VKP88_07005 [Candidatus Paceibacterota bacterium]|nr:hypothetical protein [Candidatus Paceibacterota bacterium]